MFGSCVCPGKGRTRVFWCTDEAQTVIGTMRLELAIDMDRELVRLAKVIDWEAIATESRPGIAPTTGVRRFLRG